MPKSAKESAKVRKNEVKKSYRQNQLVQKRFSYPLIPFLEIKYPDVYKEYKELHDWLRKKHPQARNLTKTATFKAWKESQTHQAVSDNDDVTGPTTISENTATTCNIGDVTGPTTTSENTTITCNIGDVTGAATSENTTSTSDIGDVTGAATSQGTVTINIEELADIMVNIEGQVDQIINELREDEDLRRIMDNVENYVAEDEGIDINPLDDIEYDIEPFDFETEVENYEW